MFFNSDFLIFLEDYEICDIAANLIHDLPSLPVRTHPSLIATVTHLFREWITGPEERVERSQFSSRNNSQNNSQNNMQSYNQNDDYDDDRYSNRNQNQNQNQNQNSRNSNDNIRENNRENNRDKKVQVQKTSGHPNDYSSKYGMTGLPQTTTNGTSGYTERSSVGDEWGRETEVVAKGKGRGGRNGKESGGGGGGGGGGERRTDERGCGISKSPQLVLSLFVAGRARSAPRGARASLDIRILSETSITVSINLR